MNAICHPFIALKINPQKINLDKTGLTLVVTAADIADALLDLTEPQLKAILSRVEKGSSFIICRKMKQ